MSIKCCNGCVAPKRHAGCHSHCPEYIEEKALHDQQMDVERKKREISNGLAVQRSAGVTKALRKRRYKNGQK